MNSLLIKNASVVDGTGAPKFAADVLVRNGRIESVGADLSGSPQIPTLDVRGMTVAPGFIDSHTHFDPWLFSDPLTEIAQHGITTIVIGNCSLGLAPLHATDRESVADLFSFVEDVPREVFSALVPWSWVTFGQYVATMQSAGYSANVLSLVGHSMLREYVMGAAAWERAATRTESNAIAAELELSLKSGAAGMSTSFFDQDPKGRAVPSRYADDAEFEDLFRILGKYRGLCQLVPRHPQAADVCADLERMARFAKPNGVIVLSNGIGDMPSMPELAPALLECARRLRADGAHLYHLLSPRSIELFINPDQTMTFMAMPAWNEMIQGDRRKKRVMLNDQAWRALARQEWDAAGSFMFPTNDLGRIRIIAVGNPELEGWVGCSVAQFVATRACHPADAFADWLLENELETRFAVSMSNFDPAKVAELAQRPEVLISGSDAGAHLQMFCGTGDSTLLLTRHVRDRQDLTLEAEIHRLTGQQAAVLGLRDRGVLRAGAIADLVIFALDELTWKPEVTLRDMPDGSPRFARPPGNYRYTIVNGEIVQVSGVDTSMRPGQFLDTAAR